MRSTDFRACAGVIPPCSWRRTERSSISRMDITTPSEPSNERERHVVADVSADSVHITQARLHRHEEDRLREGQRDGDAAPAANVQPHDLYFAAALRRAIAPGDSVDMRQYYIDREFDRFPLHHGVVTSGRSRESRHPSRLARGLRRRDVRLAPSHAHVFGSALDVQGGGASGSRRSRMSRRSASVSRRSKPRRAG